MAKFSCLFLLIILFFVFHHLFLCSATAAHSIGVNYGTVDNNLPPPSQVASFLKSQTIINRIKLFDANTDILRAFTNIEIFVIVTVDNDDIPSLSKLPAAQAWIQANISPFHPQTIIKYIAVGNEIMATCDKSLIAHTLSAMKALKSALELANCFDIQLFSIPFSISLLLLFTVSNHRRSPSLSCSTTVTPPKKTSTSTQLTLATSESLKSPVIHVVTCHYAPGAAPELNLIRHGHF